MSESPLLRVENLSVSFSVRTAQSEGKQRVRAVNGVNLTIYPRQTLAVVGESGCGKSVSAMSALQLVPTPPGRYDEGAILWDGYPDRGPVNLLKYSEKQMREIRGNHIAMIFQEPMTSLNPVYNIGDQIMEAVLLHQNVSRSQAVDIAAKALADVGIADPHARLKEYPHQMSGGMRQRIMIAMALSCQPKLLLADEPTTALDVTIQAQILELLREVQATHNMAIMLITHDLGVVAENADAVAVMYAGRIVEYGSVHDVFTDPLHPYTKGLFASMPVVGKTHGRLTVIEGQVPNLAADSHEEAIDRRGQPTGQYVSANPTLADVIMHDGHAKRVFRLSESEQPTLREVKNDHWVAMYDQDGQQHGETTRPDVAYRRAASQAATV